MKTLWLFVNFQMVFWCIGLTFLLKYPGASYPDTFYHVAFASTVLGFYGFMKANPRVAELSSNGRVLMMLMFTACLAYFPYVIPQIMARFQL